MNNGTAWTYMLFMLFTFSNRRFDFLPGAFAVRWQIAPDAGGIRDVIQIPDIDDELNGFQRILQRAVRPLAQLDHVFLQFLLDHLVFIHVISSVIFRRQLMHFTESDKIVNAYLPAW